MPDGSYAPLMIDNYLLTIRGAFYTKSKDKLRYAKEYRYTG